MVHSPIKWPTPQSSSNVLVMEGCNQRSDSFALKQFWTVLLSRLRLKWLRTFVCTGNLFSFSLGIKVHVFLVFFSLIVTVLRRFEGSDMCPKTRACHGVGRGKLGAPDLNQYICRHGQSKVDFGGKRYFPDPREDSRIHQSWSLTIHRVIRNLLKFKIKWKRTRE